MQVEATTSWPEQANFSANQSTPSNAGMCRSRSLWSSSVGVREATAVWRGSVSFGATRLGSERICGAADGGCATINWGRATRGRRPGSPRPRRPAAPWQRSGRPWASGSSGAGGEGARWAEDLARKGGVSGRHLDRGTIRERPGTVHACVVRPDAAGAAARTGDHRRLRLGRVLREPDRARQAALALAGGDEAALAAHRSAPVSSPTTGCAAPA